MAKQKKLSRIAEKKAFYEKLSQLFWIFDRVGIQLSIKEKSIDDFVTKSYKRYNADYEQISKDLSQHAWLLTEKSLSKILGEIHKKMEEHRLGMEINNGITGWLPTRAWGICINEIVPPKMHCDYFPNEGISFIFHSIISRFRHWRNSQQFKIDFERLHPGIDFEELIKENLYEKWQKKEIDKVMKNNKKRFEKRKIHHFAFPPSTNPDIIELDRIAEYG